MVSINKALCFVKQDLAKQLQPQAIFDACAQMGHTWRKCLLNPATLIHLFILQVLHKNTSCSHLRHLSGLRFTASAYCQARQRLPLNVIKYLVRKIGATMIPSDPSNSRWHGHRLWHVDGSSVSMPDTKDLQDYFGQPSEQKQGCGFPVANILVLMHAGTGMFMDMLIRPLCTNEMSGVTYLHQSLCKNDVIVADRGFCSYGHLCLLLQRQMHAIFRLRQNTIVDFHPGRPCRHDLPQALRLGHASSRYIQTLGENDQLVEYIKPVKRPSWMSIKQYQTLPETIKLRELRYSLHRQGFRTQSVTILTTLLDAQKYPWHELAACYQDRWQIEVNLDHIKTTLGMSVLHCQSVQGVKKELWIYMLVYNLVRQVMLTFSERQKVCINRISFIDALRWLNTFRAEVVLDTLDSLLVNPYRPGRYEPRVIKRRAKPYKLMTKPRHLLKQAFTEKALIA